MRRKGEIITDSPTTLTAKLKGINQSAKLISQKPSVQENSRQVR